MILNTELKEKGDIKDLQNQKITVRLFLFKNYGQQKPYKKIHI